MEMTLPGHMQAVVLTGYGGLDKLEVRDDVPVPVPGQDEVLIRVTAAGVNNTDINTRIGWYSESVTDGTTAAGGAEGYSAVDVGTGNWSGGGVSFPRIQGADVVGRIAAVGANVDPARIGERVVCNPYISTGDWLDDAGFLGADYDGGFAQFARMPATHAIAVPEDLPLTDPQLASLPCSGGTALNMLLMAGIRSDDRVLVTGASGGVGTFLVQIAKYHGAEVTAVCGASKFDAVRALGADFLVDRSAANLEAAVHDQAGDAAYTLVADVVGGGDFKALLALLGRGGRYVTAGAIAGPIVELDLRTLYLKSLSFFGSTVYRPETFPKLIEIAASGAIDPVIEATYPLDRIAEAQTAFLRKTHVGSFMLIPPQAGDAR